MAEIFRSVWQLLRGVFKRFWLWTPAILFDPFDLYDRVIKVRLPEEWQMNIPFPSTYAFWAFIALLVWATIWTYHELNKENTQLSDENTKINHRDQFSEIVGRSLDMGQRLYHLFNEVDDMFLVRLNYIPELQEITQEWRMYIHDVLLEALGPAEAVLAMDDSGYVFYADAADYQEKRIIDGRNRRLTDLIKRLNNLTIFPDFNYLERRKQLFALDERLTDLVTAFAQSPIRKF